MGRPPSNGAPAFRFNHTEVAQMESILREHQGQIPTRELLVALADRFSNSPERAGKVTVQMKQVWNWFQNRRYALRAKVVKSPGKVNVAPITREEVSVRNMISVPQQIAVPSGHNVVRTASETPPMEFEAKSARDGAWYDVQGFLSHRYLETGNPEVLVRFSGFGPEEDEWVNVRKHVRQRSLPCEASECVAVLPGDLILCFQEGKEQALYFDAHVLDAQRRRHDIRGCRCRFLVRYDHDQSEEIVPLRKVCRRPETDYRLHQLNATNQAASADTQSQKCVIVPTSTNTLNPSATAIHLRPAPHMISSVTAPIPAPAATQYPSPVPAPVPVSVTVPASVPVSVTVPAPLPVPVSKAPVPVSGAPLPVSEGSVPVSKGSVPVSGATLPVSEGPVRVLEGSVPISEGPLPVSEASIPVSKVPLPVSEASVPVSITAPLAPVSMPCADPVSAHPVSSSMPRPDPVSVRPVPVSMPCPDLVSARSEPVLTPCPDLVSVSPVPVSTLCHDPVSTPPAPVSIPSPVPISAQAAQVSMSCPDPVLALPVPVSMPCPDPVLVPPAPVLVSAPDAVPVLLSVPEPAVVAVSEQMILDTKNPETLTDEPFREMNINHGDGSTSTETAISTESMNPVIPTSVPEKTPLDSTKDGSTSTDIDMSTESTNPVTAATVPEKIDASNVDHPEVAVSSSATVSTDNLEQ